MSFLLPKSKKNVFLLAHLCFFVNLHQLTGDSMTLPLTHFPQRPDLDLFASMTPAKEVGGDLYDFIFV